MLHAYELLFVSKGLILGDVTSEVIETATGIRARYGLRAPDAIHLASAIEHRADVFLTGDAALTRCTEVKVEVLTA